MAQKAAAGDVDAFEQIYWRYHRRVFGICLRMTKNTAEAEDVTQQVFLNLFKKWQLSRRFGVFDVAAPDHRQSNADAHPHK